MAETVSDVGISPVVASRASVRARLARAAELLAELVRVLVYGDIPHTASSDAPSPASRIGPSPRRAAPAKSWRRKAAKPVAPIPNVWHLVQTRTLEARLKPDRSSSSS